MTHIRLMTAADIEIGLSLSHQAGWNQTQADWLRTLALEPDGCFVAEVDSRVAGTTTACIFGSVAWVAMVLVEPESRGRGIGTTLVQHALAWLDERGLRAVRLDATPLGAPIYERLGFVGEYEIARYAGTPTNPAALVAGVTRAARNDLPEILDLDRQVVGADRGKLLLRLFEEWPEAMRVLRHQDTLVGYLTARLGSHAIQVGPCIATNNTAATLLLADAWQRYAGQSVFVDAPTRHTSAAKLAEAAGLIVQRRLLRMRRGSPTDEQTENLWLSFGPEKG